jgi:hypothetical protein
MRYQIKMRACSKYIKSRKQKEEGRTRKIERNDSWISKDGIKERI